MRRSNFIESGQHRTVVWAFALSVVIHVLLLVLSIWFPLGSLVTATVADEPQETVLSFTFDDSEQEPTTDDPEQDARFLPVEPQPEPAPTPLPQPPAIPEIRPPEAEPTEIEQPRPREQVEASAEETPEAATGALALPQDPFGNRRSTPDTDRFSMERAMRDFGEALERAPRIPALEHGADNNVFVPDLSQIPSVGYGMGNLVFESRDYDWSDYGRQVYMAIWRAWHSRLYVSYDEFEKWAAQSGTWRLNHQTHVHFVIEGNGEVTGVTLDHGSSCRPFDDSVIDAPEEVILPPLPADFPREREVVRARFVGTGPIRAMPANLRMLKRAGYF